MASRCVRRWKREGLLPSQSPERWQT